MGRCPQKLCHQFYCWAFFFLFFFLQFLLTRHINQHFKTPKDCTDGVTENATKLIRRNGQKLRYRRQLYSGNYFLNIVHKESHKIKKRKQWNCWFVFCLSIFFFYSAVFVLFIYCSSQSHRCVRRWHHVSVAVFTGANGSSLSKRFAQCLGFEKFFARYFPAKGNIFFIFCVILNVTLDNSFESSYLNIWIEERGVFRSAAHFFLWSSLSF